MPEGSLPEKLQAIPQPPGSTGRQAVALPPGATGEYPVLEQPQDQLPAPLPQQHLQDWAPVLDALTLPQRRYLAALQSGAGQEQALLRAGGSGSKGVSPATAQEWLKSSREFARAHDAIQAGLAVLGVPQSRELAAADMPDLVGHWSRKARTAAKDRDQATFGRLLGDVSGAIPRGALVQVVAQTTVQVAPGPAPHQPGGLSPRYLELEELRALARAPVTQEQEQAQEPGRDTAAAQRDVTNPERTDDEKRS